VGRLDVITIIQEIKKRLSCPDYLARHGIHVKRGGRCVSPLRPGAKNPTSFWVDEANWYDFGAASGGDVIDLVAQMECNGDVGAAVRKLASELGLQSEYKQTWKKDIQQLCNRAAFYHKALTAEDYAYLKARGLTPEDVDRLMIGRVTDGYLKGRLFLPYFKNGAVVYYATRAMPGSCFHENKYMKASLQECESYQHIPWGLQTLNRSTDTLIISEGYFDAAVWEREGYAVLSPITGNFSKTQWPDVLSACRMFQKVLVIFDNDSVSHAGESFTERTAQKLFQARIPFMVAHTPSGIKDVNDYYIGGGLLQRLVDTAQDGLEYMVSRYTDAMELKKFIMTINRYTDSTAIAAALSSVSDCFPGMVLKTIQKAADSAPTESQIVDEIINVHNIIYVDQVGFYEWNGKVWSKTSDGVVKNYADSLYGKRFSTAQRVNAVCNLLKSRTICSVAFDRNPVMTFQNGTLEIDTGRFRDFSQSDYCSIIMDYDYSAEARCPTWCQFIQDVTDEDPYREDVLQTLAGYVLFPDCRFQQVFILVGSGGNGKSVYLEIIQKLFGDNNVTHVEPTGLAQEFQRIRLKDSLLNVGSDINSDFSKGEIREWLLKIADGTSVQACYKGMTHVDFIPRCKLVYACNAMPTAEIVNGLSRRLRFIEFPCQYVETPDPSKPKQKQRDVNLIPKLIAELPGIFNWAYAGYQMLKTVNYFTDTLEQAELLGQFEQTSNPVSVFCEDYNDSFRGTLARAEIYGWYKEWCVETGHKALSREKFIPKLRECLGERIEKETQVRLNGVRARVIQFAEG
jgi:putative DNA primase/helicase